MKKILFLIINILVLPFAVSAMAVSETFDVGDSVSVKLYSDADTELVGFHVLKASAAGEETVTLIADKVLEAGSPMVYDETNLDNGHEATVILENSLVGQQLNKVINDVTKPWRVETASLLTESDLIKLGIVKNAVGTYEIPAKYSFLAPIKQEGLSAEMYNYWTSIADTSQTAAVYAVIYNETRTDNNGVWATLESKDITKITDGYEFAIRPVVVMKKEYIECNNTKGPSNVETGISNYILPLTGVILIAGLGATLTKRKNVFKNI